MPHELRYARQGGFRRPYNTPPNSNVNFGYGGAGYGGYGNKGQYGGYRSHYPSAMKATYAIPNRPTVRMSRSAPAPLLPVAYQTDVLLDDSDDTGSNQWFSHYNNKSTFGFSVVLIIILALGLIFGRKR